MERLKKQGLVNNNEKCQFFKSHVEFPGQTVNQSGMRLLARVEAISKYLRPSTCSQLLSFLRMINFYR